MYKVMHKQFLSLLQARLSMRYRFTNYYILLFYHFFFEIKTREPYVIKFVAGAEVILVKNV